MSIAPITRSDIQRVAPLVLNRLQAMATLPQSGTVAGQSVASLMYEELGLSMRGPINDIDVFVDINMPREMRGRSQEHQKSNLVRQKTAQAGSVVTSESDGYNHMKFIAMRTTLKIAHTYRVGLVNYTLVADNSLRTSSRHYWKDPSAHPNPHPDKMSQDIVDGFDLNLVSVGINLASGAAVCSDEFLEFCNTRLIKAQTCNTPLHTLIRMAVKYWGGEISGAQCPYDSEREKLEAAIICQRQIQGLIKQSFVINSFGVKYQAKCEQFAAHLPPLKEVDRRVGSAGKEYLFHSFDIDPQPNSVVEYLADRAHSVDQNTALQLYLNGFPKMYDVATSTNPGDETRKQLLINVLHAGHPGADVQRAAELLGCSAPTLENYMVSGHVEHVSAPELFNDCLKVLGRPPILYDVPNLTPAEVAVFFHQQKCLTDPAKVDQAVAFLKQGTPELLKFFENFGLKADAAISWQANMPNVIEELLLNNPQGFVQYMRSASRDKSTAVVDILRQCIHHAHRVYQRNEDVSDSFEVMWNHASPIPPHHKAQTIAVYADISDLSKFNDPSTDPIVVEHPTMSPSILMLVSMFDHPERQEVWEKMLDMCLPKNLSFDGAHHQLLAGMAHVLGVTLPAIHAPLIPVEPHTVVLNGLRALVRMSVDHLSENMDDRFDPVHLLAPLSNEELAQGSLSEVRHMLRLGPSFQSHVTERVLQLDRASKDHMAQWLMQYTTLDLLSPMGRWHRSDKLSPLNAPAPSPHLVECTHNTFWSDVSEDNRNIERLALMLSVEQDHRPARKSKL